MYLSGAVRQCSLTAHNDSWGWLRSGALPDVGSSLRYRMSGPKRVSVWAIAITLAPTRLRHFDGEGTRVRFCRSCRELCVRRTRSFFSVRTNVTSLDGGSGMPNCYSHV